jgi:hypothetical protein
MADLIVFGREILGMRKTGMGTMGMGLLQRREEFVGAPSSAERTASHLGHLLFPSLSGDCRDQNLSSRATLGRQAHKPRDTTRPAAQLCSGSLFSCHRRRPAQLKSTSTFLIKGDKPDVETSK